MSMIPDKVVEEQSTAADAAALAGTQVGRMRAAVDRAVAVGPRFLSGDVDADHMAKAMVAAVQEYIELERTIGSGETPHGAEVRQLQAVLSELAACGSGYLANRCDAACVARTMTGLVREFHR
jgi:hypothetical protein